MTRDTSGGVHQASSSAAPSTTVLTKCGGVPDSWHTHELGVRTACEDVDHRGVVRVWRYATPHSQDILEYAFALRFKGS